jgi:hypothetical protein
MSFTTLRALFATKLEAFANTNSIDVAWENRRFNPGHGDIYLRPELMLEEARAAAAGPIAADYQGGIYQIDVFAPGGNAGWGPAYAVADLLRTEFSRGQHLTGTGVAVTLRSVSVGPRLTEKARYQLPVSVSFYAYMDAA